jgi:chromosome segregation ATPase
MTSLHDTLPILDQAVPALPGKVQRVAAEAAAFETSARAALSVFEEKRAAGERLLDQVRAAVAALDAQAEGERGHVEEARRAVLDAAAEQARVIDDGAAALSPTAQQAVSAFTALTSALEEAGDRMRRAVGAARAALGELDDRTREGQADLEQAVDKAAAAFGHLQDRIAQGQADLVDGSGRLADSVRRMLARVETRLERTRARVEELRDDQGEDVSDTLSGLVGRCDELVRAVCTRMSSDVSAGLDPGTAGLATAWADAAAQVAQAGADCEAGREALEPRLTATDERVVPLDGAVAQVKQAAERVGLAWP